MGVISEGPGSDTEEVHADADGFEDCVRQYQRMIHSACYRMTGSVEDADDLAQETFIAAFRHFEQFRKESRISSWLYRIAINRCLNWNQKRARSEALHRRWAEQLPEAHGEDPRVSQVQQALLRLDPKQRAAIVLTVYDDLTHAEAARILDCSETTVSWRVFAARRKLKRLLKSPRAEGGCP